MKEIVRAGASRKALAQSAVEERATEVINGVWISMLGLSEHFEWLSYGAACLLHPSAIICMYSACLFHDISDELPWQLWLAVDPNLTRRTGGPTLRSNGFEPLEIVALGRDLFQALINVEETSLAPHRPASNPPTHKESHSGLNREVLGGIQLILNQ